MRGLVGVLFLVVVAHGQTAADVTERSRNLRLILDALLYPQNATPRAVVLLVDPSPSLKTGKLTDSLAELLRVRKARTPRPKLGLAIVGQPKAKRALGSTPDEIVASLRAAMVKPTLELRNLYAEVRQQVGRLRKFKGRRELILISLENGDLEDKLEKTAALAAKAGVRVHVIAREAFLSDTYWENSYRRQEIKGKLHSADSAFVQMPWGWPFQFTKVTESTASGHAIYGLSRLATVSGGRAFVWYPKRGRHRCQIHATCPFCEHDHMPPFEAFRAQRVRAIAPLVGNRKAVYSQLGKDGYYQAVLEAWEAGHKAKLLYRRPPVRRAGGTLAPQSHDTASGWSWGTQSPRSIARDAAGHARSAGAIAERLKTRIEHADGSARSRSIAELTYVLYRVTRVNMLICEAYCKQIAPGQFAKKRADPPEAPFAGPDDRITGISFRNLALCHGIEPFAGVKLPGGKKLRAEVEALGPVLKEFYRRNAYTPFASALGRMGLASFYPTRLGKKGSVGPRENRGSNQEPPPNTRPERGGGTSGGSEAPTSGGG
ncbi:MAG: vWA domain-containing protein [Planctomycetota bacterium]